MNDNINNESGCEFCKRMQQKITELSEQITALERKLVLEEVGDPDELMRLRRDQSAWILHQSAHQRVGHRREKSAGR